MRHTCPACGAATDLHVAIILRHEEVPAKRDWRMRCSCGFESNGRLSEMTKSVVTLLYVSPVALLWGLFLVYGSSIEPAWLRFVVWLAQIAPGVPAGDRLGRALVRRRIASALRAS